MNIAPLQCAHCRHLNFDRLDNRTGRYYCDAFPDGDGIPRAIIDGDHDHRIHYPGDHGIRFAPRPGMTHPAEDEESE